MIVLVSRDHRNLRIAWESAATTRSSIQTRYSAVQSTGTCFRRERHGGHLFTFLSIYCLKAPLATMLLGSLLLTLEVALLRQGVPFALAWTFEDPPYYCVNATKYLSFISAFSSLLALRACIGIPASIIFGSSCLVL